MLQRGEQQDCGHGLTMCHQKVVDTFNKTKVISIFFFFNDTATTEIYTLSLHDALPISFPVRERTEFSLVSKLFSAHPDRQQAHACRPNLRGLRAGQRVQGPGRGLAATAGGAGRSARGHRSEEHTSELQSRQYLVCRLLL